MLLFLNVGGSELMVIALFVLMFFGSKNIPDLMRGLGKGMREVKDAMNGIEREVKSTMEAAPPPPKGGIDTTPRQILQNNSAEPENIPSSIPPLGGGGAD